MLKKIDHIGIAVNNIEEQVDFYKNILNLEFEKIETVESENVKVCFFKIGEVHVELLEPTNDNSPIKKFIDKKGQGIHHIAYKTDDINFEIKNLKDNNIVLLNETPKTGANQKKISFLHPKSTFSVLTEICE